MPLRMRLTTSSNERQVELRKRMANIGATGFPSGACSGALRYVRDRVMTRKSVGLIDGSKEWSY